jgi:hypothetical protein
MLMFLVIDFILFCGTVGLWQIGVGVEAEIKNASINYSNTLLCMAPPTSFCGAGA